MELFKKQTGVNLVHVPYKGLGPAVVGLLAGNVTVMFSQLAAVRAYIDSGKLRAIAVAGKERTQAMPNLPTIAESGVAGLAGFDVNPWFGFVAPAGTPPKIVAKLSAEIGKITRMPDVRRTLAPMGAELASDTPDKFGAFIRSEIVKWAKVVKAAGLKAN